MKKLAKTLAILTALLLILLIAATLILPTLLKPKLLQIAKQQVNTHLNATADLQDIDITLIKTFPNLGITLENLTIINHHPFQGDTLASIKALQVEVNLWSLLNLPNLRIRAINILQPKLLAQKKPTRPNQLGHPPTHRLHPHTRHHHPTHHRPRHPTPLHTARPPHLPRRHQPPTHHHPRPQPPPLR